MSTVIYRIIYFSSIFILTGFQGCTQSAVKEKVADTLTTEWDQTIPGNFSDQSKEKFDSLQIRSFIKKFPQLQSYESQIDQFYHMRNYAYAWFDNGQLIVQADNLSNRILNVQNDGIYDHLPYTNTLDSLLAEVKDSKTSTQKITTELMLTGQYFAFADKVWSGFDKDVSKDMRWYLPRKKVAYGIYLDSILRQPVRPFTADAPVYRQYELLKTYLAKYKKIADEDRWPALDFPAKSPAPGDSAEVIPAVKSRLFKLSDFQGDTLSRVYDGALQTALKQFQERHGLTVDGLLGRETNKALNVPIKNRIKQILVNMERCRWLPVKLKGDYLAVNIPEFKLHVYHADSLLWSCNVVVGKTVHPTVIFYGEIKYVVFSPYWNIPMSIVRNEILPGIQRNSNYLAEHRMEVTGRRQGLPVVRQLPGAQNSLGLVKFLFPNSYNIYLHDTPSKSLFEETSRDFSHGCIRVAEPARLAAFLLKDWSRDKIVKKMHAGREKYVTLANKVPVYIAYFTAFVDHNNRLQLRDDIYHLDGKLAKLLMQEEFFD